jgi:hypothetical protein
MIGLVDMTTEIIAGAIGLLASTVTASLAYYFSKQQQFASENRRIKEEFYRQFIKALNDVAQDNKNQQAQSKLAEGFNTLILVGSADVVNRLMAFHNFVKPSGPDIDRNSEQWSRDHDELLTELVRSMRDDLLGKASGSAKITGVHLVGGRGRD